MVKHLSAMQEIQVQSLGWEDPLEKETAAHSNTLAKFLSIRDFYSVKRHKVKYIDLVTFLNKQTKTENNKESKLDIKSMFLLQV